MRVSTASSQRRVEIDARGAERRDQAEEQPRHDRHRKRKGEYRAVERDGVEARNVARIDGAHHVQRAFREQQSRRAAQQPEQQTFRQQLTDQPPPVRAKGRPNGHLLLPARRARQQQVGDVRAGNEKDETNRSEQDQHRPPDVSDDRIEERNLITGAFDDG